MLNRLKEARKEIEMMDAYDYVVVNDQVDHAVEKIKSIIQSEHLKRERIAKQYKKYWRMIKYDVRTVYRCFTGKNKIKI